MTVFEIENLKSFPDIKKYDNWGYSSSIAIIDQTIASTEDNYL